MKTHLVTGGAGFIGRALVQELLDRGDRVWVLDDLSNSRYQDVPNGAQFIEGDIRVPRAKLSELRFDTVFNLACRNILVCWECLETDLSVNAGGTLALLDHFKECPTRFIQVSSESVEAELSPYAISKATAERYCKLFKKVRGNDIKVIRLSNVYGPGQRDGMIAKMVNRVKEGKPMIVYGDGTQTRDFVYIKDAVGAILELANSAIENTVSVGTEFATPVYEVARMIQRRIGGEIEFGPLRSIDNVVHRKVENSFYKCEYDLMRGLDEYLMSL